MQGFLTVDQWDALMDTARVQVFGAYRRSVADAYQTVVGFLVLPADADYDLRQAVVAHCAGLDLPFLADGPVTWTDGGIVLDWQVFMTQDVSPAHLQRSLRPLLRMGCRLSAVGFSPGYVDRIEGAPRGDLTVAEYWLVSPSDYGKLSTSAPNWGPSQPPSELCMPGLPWQVTVCQISGTRAAFTGFDAQRALQPVGRHAGRKANAGTSETAISLEDYLTSEGFTPGHWREGGAAGQLVRYAVRVHGPSEPFHWTTFNRPLVDNGLSVRTHTVTDRRIITSAYSAERSDLSGGLAVNARHLNDLARPIAALPQVQAVTRGLQPAEKH